MNARTRSELRACAVALGILVVLGVAVCEIFLWGPKWDFRAELDDAVAEARQDSVESMVSISDTCIIEDAAIWGERLKAFECVCEDEKECECPEKPNPVCVRIELEEDIRGYIENLYSTKLHDGDIPQIRIFQVLEGIAEAYGELKALQYKIEKDKSWVWPSELLTYEQELATIQDNLDDAMLEADRLLAMGGCSGSLHSDMRDADLVPPPETRDGDEDDGDEDDETHILLHWSDSDPDDPVAD